MLYSNASSHRKSYDKSFSISPLPLNLLLSLIVLLVSAAESSAQSFAPPVNYSAATNASYSAVGDVNNDGKLDLITIGRQGNYLSLLFGNGDGTFRDPVNSSVPDDAGGVAIGDFNGDGKLDLALCSLSSFGSSTLNILLGNGDGTFQPKVSTALYSFASNIYVGDFNRDGKTDLVLPNRNNKITVYISKGDGTFSPPPFDYTLTANGGATGVVGDFNGDGLLDLVLGLTGTNSSGAINLLPGTGNGDFQDPIKYDLPGGAASLIMTAADFNNDGKLDILTGGTSVNTISVLPGNGDGTFQSFINSDVGTQLGRSVIGDFNLDGNVDIASLDPTATSPDRYTLMVFAGNGAGKFQSPVRYEMTIGSLDLIAKGDFNGDGKPDIAVASGGYRSASVLINQSGPLTFSGTVIDNTNAPLSGTVINMSGDYSMKIVTGSDGVYKISGLRTGSSFTATPSKQNTAFSPPWQSFNNISGNLKADFRGNPAGTISLNPFGYFVSEGDGSAKITVRRTGDTSATATVNYATSDYTATQSSDYTVTSGTLTFAPGETTKTFTVLIIDDAYVEGNETIKLTLSNVTGAALGANIAGLTIGDNDFVQPTTNPIDDTHLFVQQQYYDFLSRYPDQGGWDYWTGQITQCGTDQNCINSRRVGVSAAYFIELEFQDTGSYVYRLYKGSYGQNPTYAQFMPDRSQVVAGSNLEAGKQAFAESFVQRFEFTTKYPTTQSAQQFIAALISTVEQGSGVNLSGRSSELVTEYNSGTSQTNSRAKVLRKLIEYPEFKTAEYNRAFVLMQYFGYLRRDADSGGYQFWLDVLNNKLPNDSSGYRSMVCAFLTSAEYQQRFSPVVTRNDHICGSVSQ